MDKEKFLKLLPKERRDFEGKLVKEFPNLYADMYGDASQTCMAFGLEIGPGWYDFIYKLSEKLERLILLEPERERKNYRASQVKEKFGALRFSLVESHEEMQLEIDKAEHDSQFICQRCGKPGKIVGKSWRYATCEEHAKEEDKHRFKQQEK